MSARIDNNQMMDFTVAINKVPRVWSLLDEMNIAETVGISTETASVDVIQERTDTFGDVRRGGPRQFVGAENVITKHLTTPFFALDGAVLPSDVQNLRRFGTENDLTSMGEAVDRIATRIRRYHSALREKALVEAIRGFSFNPNGTTEQYDYYTVFEQTANKKQIPFDLANTATDPMEKAEEVYKHIINNAQDGSSAYEIVCLASSEFFDLLLKNDTLQQAYTYYTSVQEPLRNRQGGGGIIRQFTHGNIRYIDYPATFNGARCIPANEAYFFPMGIADMFKVYHAPADHIDYTNTVGQEAYMWIYRDPKGRRIDVESETAMLAVNHRPELVVRATALASF